MKQFSTSGLSWLVGVLTAAICLLTMSLSTPVSQDPTYHQFADQRAFLGIPNFADVVSNMVYLIVGLWGLFAIAGERLIIVAEIRSIYLTLFTTLILVALGSSYFHLDPDNSTLLWDRLPITLAFMTMFVIVIAEFVDIRLARCLFPILLPLGLATVFYWHVTELNGNGDLRPYLLVQVIPLLLLPILLIAGKNAFTRSYGYWWVLLAYVLAKVFELYDREVFDRIGGLSGHSLKHLASALGVAVLIRSFQVREKR